MRQGKPSSEGPCKGRLKSPPFKKGMYPRYHCLRIVLDSILCRSAYDSLLRSSPPTFGLQHSLLSFGTCGPRADGSEERGFRRAVQGCSGKGRRLAADDQDSGCNPVS